MYDFLLHLIKFLDLRYDAYGLSWPFADHFGETECQLQANYNFNMVLCSVGIHMHVS